MDINLTLVFEFMGFKWTEKLKRYYHILRLKSYVEIPLKYVKLFHAEHFIISWQCKYLNGERCHDYKKRLNIMKWAILSKLVVRSSATFIKVHQVFWGNWQANLIICMIIDYKIQE